jgi:uncharacterized protein
MWLSRYVVTYRDVRHGEHVLYDVVSDRFVGVDDAGLAAIGRWTIGPPTATEAGAAAALTELGFLVDGEESDRARLHDARRRAAEGRPGSAVVTLMPTLACDLACTYCFQKEHPAQGHMSPSVEAAALAFIERAAGAPAVRRLELVYLGGEPLTRKDFVLRTAAHLALAMRRSGKAFAWQLITNGIALDVPFARAMAALGPGQIKVTLDGDRETHDQARIYRDGRPSFDRIFAALRAVALECPEVKVRVGGNFRGGQEASYQRLLDRMADEGLAGRIQSVQFKPLMEAGGCASGCGSAPGGEAIVQLGRRAAERGLSLVAPAGGTDLAPCELHWEHAWTIDPAGRIYRCLAVAGRPELALGDVWTGPSRPDPLTRDAPWEACGADCPFVPVCMGGCVGGAVASGGSLGRPACDRADMERRFRAEIARRYLEEFPPEATEAPEEEAPTEVHAA